MELKASLLDSIEGIDDVGLIERISRYVRNVVDDARKNRITKSDLVIDPEIAAIVKDLNGGAAINDDAAMHEHWKEKYQ